MHCRMARARIDCIMHSFIITRNHHAWFTYILSLPDRRGQSKIKSACTHNMHPLVQASLQPGPSCWTSQPMKQAVTYEGSPCHTCIKHERIVNLHTRTFPCTCRAQYTVPGLKPGFFACRDQVSMRSSTASESNNGGTKVTSSCLV